MGVPEVLSVFGKGGRLNRPTSEIAVELCKSAAPGLGSAGEAKPSKSAGVRDWSPALMQYHMPSALVGALPEPLGMLPARLRRQSQFVPLVSTPKAANWRAKFNGPELLSAP